MFSKVVLVALAAGAQVSFAAPLHYKEERSLKAVGTALVGGAASLITGAVLNNKRSDSGIYVDTETGTLYMDVPSANEGRSLKAIGTAVAGGIASGVAGAVVKDILNKRADISDLMVDTDTGVIYMNVPDAHEGRSLKAIGTAVAGGIASGVAGAVAKDIFNKRSEPSGLMVDTDTGIIYMDVAGSNERRSLIDFGNVENYGISGGIASESLRVGSASPLPDYSTNDKRSFTAIGNFISGLFNKRGEHFESSGLMVDTDTGIIYMDVADTNEGRSLATDPNAYGTPILSSYSTAPSSASNVFGNNKRSFTAIGNFISGLFNKRGEELDERSLTAIGNFISGLFDKRDELDERSFTAIGNFISGLFDKRDGGSADAINHQIKQILQRSELAASMAARSIDDLE